MISSENFYNFILNKIIFIKIANYIKSNHNDFRFDELKKYLHKLQINITYEKIYLI